MYNEGELLKALVELLSYLLENICMCTADQLQA